METCDSLGYAITVDVDLESWLILTISMNLVLNMFVG